MRVIALAAVLLLLAVSAGWGGLADGSSSAKLDGGHGDVDAISCAAAGECTAGGYYIDGRSHLQAFVVSMVNGSWGTVTKVPGLASLGRGGGDASVDTISCAAVGECAAGGSYSTSSDRSQAYVASETNGSWGKAIEVPGTAKLNAGGEAYVVSISCGAPGECAAGGVYYDRHDQDRAFVVSETGGVWGTAIEVPGTAKRNSAGVNTISCVAAGECTAAGEYQDGFDSTGGLRLEAFVVTETNGSWGNAIEVPGTASLNTSHNASASSISCVTAGNCAAGGSYVDGKHREQVLRRQRDERQLGRRDRGAGHYDAQQQRRGRAELDFVCRGR